VIGTSASAQWSPADLSSLAAWFDADDAATVLTDGSSVTNWLDKSGNDNHATQASGTAQPMTGRTFTNTTLNVLDFDGTDDRLGLPSLGLTDGAIVFAVFEVDDTEDNRYTVVASGKDGLDTYLGTATPHVFLSPSRLDGISAGMPTTGAHFYSKSALVSGDSYQYYVDGSLTPTADGSTSGKTFDGNKLIFIGGTGEGNFTADPRFHLDGAIGEVIVLDERPDYTTRQKVEGYLAWKWGLVDLLPTDHDWKDEDPGAAPATPGTLIYGK